MSKELTDTTLLVLAAGMGSRYGGLKQLDGVGPHGETIMDYSIYDALQAGFSKVVFVIRHDFENEFRQKVLSRYEGAVPVEVAFQDREDLPEGYSCPEWRTKPWGTGHAVLAARNVVKEPFAVINADDFYGRDSYRVLHEQLAANSGQERAVDSSSPRPDTYCMVGFRVGNTMTENGTVSRGVCTPSEDGKRLANIVERKGIRRDENGRVCFDVDGDVCHISEDTPVSMNFWGFTPGFFEHSMGEFRRFLDKYINEDGREFYIPSVVDKLIRTGRAEVRLLDTESKWFGVTYSADREGVVASLARLHANGTYPETLF